MAGMLFPLCTGEGTGPQRPEGLSKAPSLEERVIVEGSAFCPVVHPVDSCGASSLQGSGSQPGNYVPRWTLGSVWTHFGRHDSGGRLASSA